MPDVYLYGMTVLSSIHKLAGPFPELDTYGEIAESFVAPGGETMNAAIVLSNLGLSTRIGGPRFGRDTETALRRYAERYDIDVSSVTSDPAYPGVRDLILVDDRHRTVFGTFKQYFEDPVHRWDEPEPQGIAEAAIVSIDPFFGTSSERAALLAKEAGVPYVTIDCPHDGPLHQGAAATVVSREYRQQRYPGMSDEILLDEYGRSPGLTVFTAGMGGILYRRSGKPRRRFDPYRVETTSTLGAGDVFRAGVVYGLFRNMDDDQGVRFASALAATACTRMPIADHPPGLHEVEERMRSRDS